MTLESDGAMESEWSHLFDVNGLEEDAVDLSLSPSADECARIARRLDIGSLDKFSAQEEFEGWFADKDAAVSLAKVRKEKMIEKGKTELPILEERDDPEPIVEGMIDLGELCVQHLSLAINPYPHAEGVEYEHGDDAAQGEGFSFKNPFAALKDWKAKQGNTE